MRFTDEQYRAAIAHLEDARTQLAPDGHCCACCGDSGHQAFECGHNPLVAMAMCEAIAETADGLHDRIHKMGDKPPVKELRAQLEQYHELLHQLSGSCTYMGVQLGPARIVLP